MEGPGGLSALEQRASSKDLEKLRRIRNPEVHRFIAACAELCNPDRVFVCSDTPDEIAYIKHMAIASGEESAALATPATPSTSTAPLTRAGTTASLSSSSPRGTT